MQNIDTYIVSIFFICAIALILIMILTLQMKFNFSGSIDAYKNNASFRVGLFGIPLFKIFVCMGCGKNGEGSILITIGPKTKELHLNKDKEDKDSIMSQKTPPVFSNLLVENLKVDIRLGTMDAFLTMAIMQTIKIMFYGVFSVLKTRQDLEIEERFTPMFNSETIQVFIGGILSISLADIIYSFISAKIRGIRRH